jgi:hypothetical protein
VRITGQVPLHDQVQFLLVFRLVRGQWATVPSQHREAQRRPACRTAPVDFQPGAYRVFADFQPAGESEPLTLGSDLTVAGSPNPGGLPEPASESVVEDYTVTIDGTLSAGAKSRLSFDVTRAGRPVPGLQPYLGAPGHLVALRAGDLAYLHVHPTDNGPSFDVEVPSPSTYRRYLDFKHGGVVWTAEFTAVARADASPAPPARAPTWRSRRPT